MSESAMFFGRKIKGTLSFFCGLFLIISNFKIFGILFQFYGIYEFFKFYANKLIDWVKNMPIIGPIISIYILFTPYNIKY
jgi:hypothetical protein